MFCQAGFDPWLRTIMQHLPQLSKPQATVLAWGSFGMVRIRSCALTAVSHLLAQGMHRKEQTVRQQWRAGYDEVPRKRGTRRQALPVATCVPGLLGWGVRGWHGTPLALALEATALGTRVVGWAVPGRRSRVRPSRSLGGAAGPYQAGRAAGVAALAAPAGARPAPRLEGEGVGGARRGGAVAVAAPHPAGLASVCAPQHGRQLSAPRGALRAARDALGAPARPEWARPRPGLDPPPRGRPVAGARGSGGQSPLADPDRSGAGGQGCRLVWPAGLDRTGGEEHAARGLAGAPHPEARARSGGTAVGGRCRRDVVAAQRRG